MAIITAIVGSVLLACGIRGYAHEPLSEIQRILVIAAGLLFIAPGLLPPLIGLAIVVIAYTLRYLKSTTAAQG